MTPRAPSTTMTTSRSEAMQDKMDSMGTLLDRQGVAIERQGSMLQEIVASLKEISERMHKMETDSIGVLTTLQNQMASAFRRIDETRAVVDKTDAGVRTLESEIPEKLRERLEKLENVMPGLVLSNKIMIFVATAVTVSLVALLWAIFTGQAAIVYK